MIIERGDIWLVNLDPTVGSEIRKTRPALVLSNDVNNRYNNVITIVPLTSNISRIFDFEVLVEPAETGLLKPSKVKADQIRTIDKIRLINRLGSLASDSMKKVELAVKLQLGLS